MKNAPITKSIDALSARTHFGEIMEQAEQEDVRFLVSRRGKPKVVILSVNDYLKNVVKQPELLTRVQVSAKETGLEKLTDKQINAEINAYRKQKKRSKK